MYHGSMDEMRSGAGTPRRSNDGHKRTSIGPRSATPRSDQVPNYPVYTNPPTSISGGTDMDYDYEERDLGTSHQARPQYYQTPQLGPRSHNSAPPAPNRGYSYDPYQSHHNMPYSPPPVEFSPNYYNSAPSQNSFPEHHSEPTRPNEHYWYAGPPSTSPSPFGYFPVTHPSHDSDPALFGVKAPHHHSGHNQGRQEEVLPNFPQWSRTWYDGHMSPSGHAYTSVPPPASGRTGWESETMSRQGPPSGPYGHVYGHQSMTDFVKEERIRMLEKEFGQPKLSRKGGAEDGMDDDDDIEEEDADLPLGSVTSKGKLVTERPKWNLALRILIGLVSLISCACGLGGALLIKTTSDSKPAPKGTLSAYLLYGCSVITLVVLIYFYLFRPCCDPMRKELQSGLDSGNPLSGMVIPILSGGGPGGKAPKQKKYGKKGFRGMQQQQAPTVNLIVDPALLGAMGGGNRDKDESDDEERLPGDARRSRKRKNGLGVLGNMQMQRRWQLARNRVKLLTILDVILCINWIACNVVSLGFGKKCSASTGGTWCTFYNLTIASGVILDLLFLIAIYFDYRDLRISRNKPKLPM